MTTKKQQDEFGANCKAEIDVSIGIDFDGVIFPLGGNPVYPELDVLPIPGSKEALEAIHSVYPNLILHTCRAREDRPESAIPHIEAWLKKHDMAHLFSEITALKPRVTFYIDDKGIRHTDWKSTLGQIGVKVE